MSESDMAKTIIQVTKKADKLVKSILRDVAEAQEVLEELKKLRKKKDKEKEPDDENNDKGS